MSGRGKTRSYWPYGMLRSGNGLKWCYVCREEWPLESFTLAKWSGDGRENRCRACRAERRNKLRRQK